ncbi:MAG: DUF3180 domain-containing protein [Actinobacteria bacterium]|nr:DUF3180 domain-containing protein [Actinomycetota bacterium]
MLVVAVLAYFLLRIGYGSIPQLQYVEGLPIAALGVAEIVAARRVRMAVRHVPDAKPMTAIAIARCVALGKATALVGAGVVGACVAVIARVLPDAGTVHAAAADLRVGLILLAASVFLTVAGVLLERAGIAPRNDRDRVQDGHYLG